MKSLPIKMFTIYILTTLFLSFFGPMKYYNYDKLLVFLYVIGFLFCLYLGYAIANRYKIVLKKKPQLSHDATMVIAHKNQKKIKKFVRITILIAFFSIFLEFFEILIKNPAAFSLSNMAGNYFEINLENSSSFYSIPILFRFLTGFFRNASIILGIYYWRTLKKSYKVILLMYFILLVIVNMLAYGTQKFLGDLVIFTVIVLSIRMMDSDKKRAFKIIKNSIILVLLLIVTFTFVQSQRYALLGVTVENYGIRSGGQLYFDTNHIIFKILGNEFGLGLAILLTGYLSSGYYGLSLCFKLPFEWTYGIGNSYFMSKLISVVFKTSEIYDRTYLNRMTEVFGRNGLRTWNTIFPWLASDFTFLGTLLIFIFVGYIWQTAWLEIIKYRNPVSILLFSILSLGLVFVPANNQLFNSIDTFISTVTTILFWLFYHKKYNYKVL